MKKTKDNLTETGAIDTHRRKLLGMAGAGAIATTLGGVSVFKPDSVRANPGKTLRWGVVGTGGIAHRMAPMFGAASSTELVAVSSRKMEKAKKFAATYNIGSSFDSWAEMLESDDIDAIYIATPTSVKEEICVAAANHGKHVLGEKPFADLPSLKRITSACRTNGVGFMDGTHFVHHPRTAYIKSIMSDKVGWPWSVDSAFQFGLSDTSNIRYNTRLEPYGAVGDAGWYNMRVAVEYTSPGVKLVSAETFIRRESTTNAVVSGSGVLIFDDGSTSAWTCGFDSGAGIMDLRISGAAGVIKLDDFLTQRPEDQPADFEYRTDWNDTEQITVPTIKPEAAIMFEDYAAMVGNAELSEASMHATEQTQEWLDAAWNSALENEHV